MVWKIEGKAPETVTLTTSLCFLLVIHFMLLRLESRAERNFYLLQSQGPGVLGIIRSRTEDVHSYSIFPEEIVVSIEVLYSPQARS